jgi:WD40 repeat protein
VTLQFSPDGGRLAASYDVPGKPSVLEVWDLAHNKRVSIPLRAEAARGLAFSPDGRHLAACRGDNFVSLYDPESGAERKTVGGSLGSQIEAAFSPGGEYLAVSTRFKRLAVVFDVEKGAEITTFEM